PRGEAAEQGPHHLLVHVELLQNVGIAAVDQALIGERDQVETEGEPQHQHEDRQDQIGQGRNEVGGQLPSGNGEDASHDMTPRSSPVSFRNTSSRVGFSAVTSASGQRSSTARSKRRREISDPTFASTRNRFAAPSSWITERTPSSSSSLSFNG